MSGGWEKFKSWIPLMRLRDYRCFMAPGFLCMEAGQQASGHNY